MVIVAGKPRFFKNPKAQAYLDALAVLGQQYAPRVPFAGPIRLELTFVLQRPKMLCRKSDPRERMPHTKRPDVDNLIKGTLDGLSLAGFWVDDAQVYRCVTVKEYAEIGGDPRIIVSIEEVP
jgi:Holliday junction resolvase RusA-like endonuclease